MVDHLAKPVLPEWLIRMLLRWSAKRRDAEPTLPTLRPDDDASRAAFERDVLHRSVHGDESLVRKLAGIFRQRDRDAAAALARWVADGDLMRARDKAHDLKGGAGAVGALSTALAAEALQRTLDGDGVNVQQRVAALQHALSAALEAIDAFLPDPGPPL